MRPSRGGVAAGAAVVDQPIAGCGVSRVAPVLWAALRGLVATAAGTQRPPSAAVSPAGHGRPQVLSVWPCSRLRSTKSGSSTGKLALTRSVKVFMARLVEVVQPPLISPS